MKRLAGLFLMIAASAFALGSPGIAFGHAALRTSDPEANSFLQRAPTQITLSFTEPLDAKSSSIQLLDASGKKLQIGAATVNGGTMTSTLPQLSPGIYNVLWANVSRTDGHGISGSFPFTVLNPDGSLPNQVNSISASGGAGSDPAPLADGIAVRALSLLGLVMVAAGALITLLWDSGDKAVRRGIELTIYAGAAVVLIATALNFETIHNTYANSSYSDLVFRTPSGGYWLTRIGLVLLITVSASFLHEAPRRTGAALMGCVVIYLWAYTSTSHAAAGLGSSWAKGLDIAHASAAVTWIGAVVGLAIASRLGNARDRWSELLPRFSLLASCMVFIVLTSGVMSAFIEMDAVSKLWRTRYGITLLIKVAVMLPLLLVAGYNARWGKGLLTKGNEAARRRFVLFAFAELALGLAVFGFAAALTQTTVSKSVILQKDVKPFDQTLPFGDLQIHLAIDPNRTGLNTYKVTLEKNNAAVAAERVRLTFRYQDDASVGASTLTLTENQGTYVGQGPFMTLEGRWRVETEVRRADVDDVVGFFDVRPAGTPVVGNLSGGPWSNPAPGLTWNQFGGLIFLLAGFGFALSRTPLRRAGKQAGWVGSGATMAGFAFGILLLFGVHNHAVVTGLPTNPIVNDRDSIATGQKLYAQNCAACHGQSGVPPKGLDLNPYPLDLTVHVPQHPDGQLYEFISKGIPGTAMAAWGDGRLTTEQIWHLVNYLRTLTPVDR